MVFFDTKNFFLNINTKRRLRLYNTQTKTHKTYGKIINGAVLITIPNSTNFITGHGLYNSPSSYSGACKLWDVSGNLLKTYGGDNNPQVTCLAIHPDNTSFISGDDDGVCKQWDISSGKCLNIYIHYGKVLNICILKDGTKFIVDYMNSTQLFDINTNKPISVFNRYYPVPMSSILLPDDKQFVSYTQLYPPLVVDIQTCQSRLLSGTVSIFSAKVHPNNRHIYIHSNHQYGTPGTRGKIEIYDTTTFRQLSMTYIYTHTNKTSEFSPDCKQLLIDNSHLLQLDYTDYINLINTYLPPELTNIILSYKIYKHDLVLIAYSQ